MSPLSAGAPVKPTVRPVLLGVHEDTTPESTVARFPGARLGRVFLAGKGPDKALDVMPAATLVARVMRQVAPPLAVGWRAVVSFKLKPTDVKAGKWDGPLEALGQALVGLDVEVVPWHEPENDLTAAVFAPSLARIRRQLRSGNPLLPVGYCAMGYQWAPGRAVTKDPRPWAAIEADRYYCDAYLGKSYPGALMLPEHPGVARWHTEVIAGRPERTWGFLEYGRAAGPERPAGFTRDFGWLATDPVGKTCSVLNVWATGGTEDDERWLLDDESAAAVAAGFARLTAGPSVPVGYEPGPVAGTLVHTATGAVIAASRTRQWDAFTATAV